MMLPSGHCNTPENSISAGGMSTGDRVARFVRSTEEDAISKVDTALEKIGCQPGI